MLKPHRALLVITLLLAACTYEAPLTEKPTGKIDERLLGDWLENDAKPDEKGKHLIVVKWSGSEYLVQYGGPFRAFHSDFGGIHFISVQSIVSPKDADREFLFVTYELQNDGKKLVLRAVSDKIVSSKLKTTVEIQKAVSENLKNPQLLGEQGVYTKVNDPK